MSGRRKRGSVYPQARVDRSKRGAANRIGRKRHLKKLVRRRGRKIHSVIAKRQSKEILDALRAGRKGALLPAFNSSSEPLQIKLKNFSLVDDPDDTLSMLSQIALADGSGRDYSVDFSDEYCLDIGAYLIFGLMQEEMEGASIGGEMTPRVAKVLKAVGMESFMRMQIPSPNTDGVFPFPLSRRSAVSQYSPGFESHESAKEKHARRFADSLDKWLHEADMELSEAGGDQVRSMISEILDNTRHANPTGDDGEWAMAGFMATRDGPDEEDVFVCHLAIASIGKTFSETLLDCEDPDVREDVAAYTSAHSSSSAEFNADTLRTVCAFTDRVSCEGTSANEDLGGCGMSSLMLMLEAISSSLTVDQEPRITVVSGNSCIRAMPPYNKVILTGPDRFGFYSQPFNDRQSLEFPPNGDYVYELKERFPGTVIALRFVINPSELRERAAKAA